jgi:TolB-like protein/Flp pilus assembly protein TadD
MSFFTELKRRNIFKVAIAYAVATWVLLQIVDLVLDNINAPEWVMQVFMLGLAVGFPIAIIIAWAFEVTPDGVVLAKNVDQKQSISQRTGYQLNRGIIMILSVGIVFLLTDKYRDEIFSELDTNDNYTEETGKTAPPSGSIEGNKSIAVLPFRDMSSAQNQAYFGEGIAEELLNALVKIDGLDVASRTSSFSLTGENLDIPAIAARLGVDHILEGSIRTAGQQVRVTAQLIEVSNDVHLWSETYDGSLDDIFKIQDEITSQITAALKVQLGSEGLAPASDLLTNNAEAYQLYLQGRHLWRQRNSAGLSEAIRLFKEAVRLDPEFHRAWSNLAIAYLNMPDYDRSYSAEEGFERGLEAAEKALEIWPESTEALIITANYNEFNCNTSEAARLYEKAITLNPDDPTAHHWYAILLSSAGHTAQALEHIQIARRIDPLISAVIGIEAAIRRNMGDYAQAEELSRTASSLGMYGGSLYPVGMNYLYAGNIERGKALIEDGWDGEDPVVAAGRPLFLQALTDPDKQAAFENQTGPAEDSQSYAVSDNVEFLSILGSSYVFEYLAELDCPLIASVLWSEPFMEQRKTPAFFELMERAGAVEYWREFGWPDDCASLDQSLAECE